MNYRSQSLHHHGGTKSYHFTLIETVGGPSVVIFRWGKTGQFGEIDVKLFSTHSEAEKAFNKKFQDKTRNGYQAQASVIVQTINNVDGLRKALGPAVLPKIGKEALLHLDPTIDVTGMRSADAPQYDEQGVKRDNARRADLAAAIEAEKKAKADRAKAVLLSNPDFGAF